MEQQEAENALAHAEAEARFKQIFTATYQPLQYYAYTLVKDVAAAEEIVQEVFCRLWERNGPIRLDKATPSYLYRAVHNESLNHLKRAERQQRYRNTVADREAVQQPVDQADLYRLQEQARAALAELPEQCRTIFQLSRYEHLRNREIAEKLGLSVKTVETQMTKALKFLRTRLADYLPVLWLCIIGLKK